VVCKSLFEENELIHVDDDPGRMEDEEGDDDVEEDEEQVQLLLQLLFCPKSLNLYIPEVVDDVEVEGEHEEEGEECRENHVEIGPVKSDKS